MYMLSARAPTRDTIQGGTTLIYGASGSGRTTIAASLLKIIAADKVILIQPGIVYQDRSSLCGVIDGMIETYTQEEFTDATLSNIISEREAELWISEEKNIQAHVTALVFECNYLLYTNNGIFAKMQICEQLGITTIITLHTDKCIPAEAKMMACMEIFSEPRAAISWIGRMSTGLNRDQRANAIACVDDAFGDSTLPFQKLYWDRLEQQWHKHVVTSARICNDE
jgi:ABC-type dipeptide/oligopeptide/nickel transport system ATPase component